MRILMLLAIVLLASSCKKTIDTKLKVSMFFQMQTAKAGKVYVGTGTHPIRIDLENQRVALSIAKHKISFVIPKLKESLQTNEPIFVSGKDIGQPFSIILTRTADYKDLITVFIQSIDFELPYGKIQFKSPIKIDGYDEKKMTFLESYQKVKRSQRGVVVKINSDMDDGTLSDIFQYGSKYWIYPWIKVRYAHIQWFVGNLKDPDTTQRLAWEKMYKKAPVVDYFAIVHGGDAFTSDFVPGNDEYDVIIDSKNRKQYQLRAVYDGGCQTRYSTIWLKKYGAAVAAGHMGTAASPLFSFKIIKNWIYGNSWETTLEKAWRSGVRSARALEWGTFLALWEEKFSDLFEWENMDQLIEGSVIGYSSTRELPASKVFIGLSTVVESKELEGESANEYRYIYKTTDKTYGQEAVKFEEDTFNIYTDKSMKLSLTVVNSKRTVEVNYSVRLLVDGELAEEINLEPFKGGEKRVVEIVAKDVKNKSGSIRVQLINEFEEESDFKFYTYDFTPKPSVHFENVSFNDNSEAKEILGVILIENSKPLKGSTHTVKIIVNGAEHSVIDVPALESKETVELPFRVTNIQKLKGKIMVKLFDQNKKFKSFRQFEYDWSMPKEEDK